eukprot:TRINITY_DN1105_c0_g1_i2.p1 TRINITY_DN1105_c0_g1~~TRINITY_DN1105_c0_g1_i2.p1  ORF type:complete len:474 (+),score=142.20 TRINITY_DN1105_c0_g1_i2:1640-3061(+)
MERETKRRKEMSGAAKSSGGGLPGGSGNAVGGFHFGDRMEGLLWKEGKTIRKWRRRYLVVEGGTLKYYNPKKKNMTDEMLGTINLLDAHVQEGFRKGRPYVFEIVVKDRAFAFAGETASEKEEWVEAIDRCKFEALSKERRRQQGEEADAMDFVEEEELYSKRVGGFQFDGGKSSQEVSYGLRRLFNAKVCGCYEKQWILTELLQSSKYQLDLEAGTIRFIEGEEGQRASASSSDVHSPASSHPPRIRIANVIVYGTFSSVTQTWMWAWGNTMLPKRIREQALVFKEYGKMQDILELQIEQFGSQVVTPSFLGLICSSVVDAIGYFVCPFKSGFLYLGLTAVSTSTPLPEGTFSLQQEIEEMTSWLSSHDRTDLSCYMHSMEHVVDIYRSVLELYGVSNQRVALVNWLQWRELIVSVEKGLDGGYVVTGRFLPHNQVGKKSKKQSKKSHNEIVAVFDEETQTLRSLSTSVAKD